MFGFSLGEFMMICVVALVFVGPKKLPFVLNTLGRWIRKARIVVQDMRSQSGIDEILRAEGLHGGINELRSLVRVQHASIISSVSSSINPNDPLHSSPPSPSPEPALSSGAATETGSASPYPPYTDPAFTTVEVDATKEYPPEGADAYGALPDDLIAPPADMASLAPAAPADPLAAEVGPAIAADPVVPVGAAPQSEAADANPNPVEAPVAPPAGNSDPAKPSTESAA